MHKAQGEGLIQGVTVSNSNSTIDNTGSPFILEAKGKNLYESLNIWLRVFAGH